MNQIDGTSRVQQPDDVIQIEGLTKQFGHITALRGVDLTLRKGEVLGLVGDNGAGKSTLLKILAGVTTASSGSVVLDGKSVTLDSPGAARKAGIETVFQDLALALDLSVASNLFLGRERVRAGIGRWIGWLDRKGMAQESMNILSKVGINRPDTGASCEGLSGGQRQAVAIARAMTWKPDVLLLDEPTAALGVAETARVSQIIRDINAEGTSTILVSHNIPQVHDLCDRVAVLWRGTIIAVLERAGRTTDEIVRWITGAAMVTLGGSGNDDSQGRSNVNV